MKGNCGECTDKWFCEINPDECDEWPDPVSMTNADRIRVMSDEELAQFLSTKLNDDFYDWPDLTLQWLQQPAEEDFT